MSEIKIKEIAFTSYAVSNLKRSRAFYEKILGLKPGSVWEGKGMGFIEYYIGAHTLAIGKGAPSFKPGPTGATVAFEVENFDVSVKELKKNKVKFVLEPQDTGVCHMALISDPDKNLIMIHKRKKK